MPEGDSFSMTVAQNGHYVADPIAQHVLHIDLETMTIEGDIEIDFTPSFIAVVRYRRKRY
jgi:hypothetical protein